MPDEAGRALRGAHLREVRDSKRRPPRGLPAVRELREFVGHKIPCPIRRALAVFARDARRRQGLRGIGQGGEGFARI